MHFKSKAALQRLHKIYLHGVAQCIYVLTRDNAWLPSNKKTFDIHSAWEGWKFLIRVFRFPRRISGSAYPRLERLGYFPASAPGRTGMW